MPKIYAIANRKGGCSKTTTAGALASGLSRKGARVLVVDLDPQGNITDWTGFDTEGKNTVYEILAKRCEPCEAIYRCKHYDLMPADMDLANLSADLENVSGREYRLREAIQTTGDDYDVVVIDTPPQLSVFMPLAMTAAADGVVVPTDNGRFAMKGMDELRGLIAETKKYTNPDIRVAGILLTKYNNRQNVSKTMAYVTRRFSEYFDCDVYKTFIRQSVGIVEAQISSTDIFDTPKALRGAANSAEGDGATEDYRAWVDEFCIKENIFEGGR